MLSRITFLARILICFPTCFQSLSPGATIARVRLVSGVIILKAFDGYGISTVCASATPSGLALAPAYLGRTNLPLETLDFRPLRFSRNSRYSFRHSHFSSVHMSFRSCFAPMRTLPYPVKHCLSFGYILSPVKSSAQHHSTSELLRTLLMSGCF